MIFDALNFSPLVKWTISIISRMINYRKKQKNYTSYRVWLFSYLKVFLNGPFFVLRSYLTSKQLSSCWDSNSRPREHESAHITTREVGYFKCHLHFLLKKFP